MLIKSPSLPVTSRIKVDKKIFLLYKCNSGCHTSVTSKACKRFNILYKLKIEFNTCDSQFK